MFEGIFTPIATPFSDDEGIDYEGMRHNLERWMKTDLEGLVVLGSNGEFVFLSEAEKEELVGWVVERVSGRKKVMAGTGCESTQATIELTRRMARLGVDAVLVLPPHYYRGRMTDEILYRHFTEVAEASSIPLFLYNMPANTGIHLSASLVARLSRHPNIVGIKDTSGNIVHLAEVVRDTADDFAVFAGNAGYLLPALALGAKGATLALANLLPEDCCRLYGWVREGRLEEAQRLQLRMLEINFLVTSGLGVPALKYAMDLLGYRGGSPRRPLRPLAESERKRVKEALVRYGALELDTPCSKEQGP
jgi:4-hydroxy-2-oxoglutarate aldolase